MENWHPKKHFWERTKKRACEKIEIFTFCLGSGFQSTKRRPPKASSTRSGYFLVNAQKILVYRGGTHFFDLLKSKQKVVQKKSTLGRILVYRGGTQLRSQKILVDWGGTQIGTFWKIAKFEKRSFSKIISSDFDILFLNFYYLLI